MKRSPLIIAGRLAVSLGLMALSVTGISQGNGSTLVDGRYQGSSLRVEAQAANVSVVTHDAPGIHVLAVQRGGRSGDFTVTVSEADGAVIVRDQARPRLSNANLTYTISVPEGTPVNLSVMSGNIDLTGLRARASITARSGNVKLRDYQGNLEVALTSGNIEIETSRVSPASVRTSSGNIRVRNSSGPLVLHSNSGNINVYDAHEGAVQLSGNSGNIELSARLPDGSENSIRQGSGNITAYLGNSNVRLEASVRSGNINSSLALSESRSSRTSLSGTLGTGSASLTVELSSGNVRLEP